MYARVTRWENGTEDEVRGLADMIGASDGPPEGVPASGIMLLTDPENGRSTTVVLFDSEEDMRAGDAALRAMNPPDGMQLSLSSVEMYEVAVDRRL